MAISVNIGEAKTRLSKLIAAAERGEEVTIARNGSPVVRLNALEPPSSRAERRRRIFGKYKSGMSAFELDALLAPLSDEELKLFHGADDCIDDAAAA